MHDAIEFHRRVWDGLMPRSRDFGAGDNLTLVYQGRRKASGLTETEIKFEAIEPGQSMLDAFLLKFCGQIS